MALTLIATAGASNANSYASVADADVWHEGRLHNESWFTATTANKEAALVWATSILDPLAWIGKRVNDTQALRWPRSWVYDLDGKLLDDSTIPQFLKNATAEYAFFLLLSDRFADADTAGFKSIKVSTIDLEISPSDRVSKMPSSVKNIIAPFRSGGTGIRLVRA